VQPDTSVKRLLIYRLGSLGDTAIALPCFHLIARAFPRAERILLSNFPVHAKAPAAAAVLDGSGLVSGYMSYSTGTRSLLRVLRLAWKILRFHPDLLVYLAAPRGEKAVRRDALFFRLCGVRRIIGLPTADLATNRFNQASGFWESEAARLLRCMAPLGTVDMQDVRNFDLRLTDAETTQANELLAPFEGRPFIACGPGTKMQAKDWGRDNWRQLLADLGSMHPDHALALIGARDDFHAAEYAAAHWNGPKINLCGSLTPRETAAVLKRAAVFLGPDSGPMHLAACVGTPCVIAFSARGLPGVWFPAGPHHQVVYHQTTCHGCQLETCIIENRRCLTSITVEEMTQAAAQVLNRNPA
jgi:ADP-heptose:LPS heptosyltransferase